MRMKAEFRKPSPSTQTRGVTFTLLASVQMQSQELKLALGSGTLMLEKKQCLNGYLGAEPWAAPLFI